MKKYILTSILFFSISCVFAQEAEHSNAYDIRHISSVIVPLEVVKEKAIERHFYNELRTEVGMGYLDNDGKTRLRILVWIFTNPPIEHYRDRAPGKRLIYNAHTGDFIAMDTIYFYATQY